MTHTAECMAYQQTLAEDRAEWQAKWPNHCKRCEGAGGFDIPATRDTPPDYDVCECVDAGTCPRCGCPLDLVDQDGELLDGDCGGCGWTGRGSDDICPPGFDGCGCAEDDPQHAGGPVWDDPASYGDDGPF